MSISMATYVAESSFSNLTKVSEQAKVMIESWAVSNNDTITEQISFNPVIPVNTDRSNLRNEQISKDDYLKYSWLFGRR
jgi:hypothetical protein